MPSQLPNNLISKFKRLSDIITESHKVSVAFSGGVDSSLLLYAAHRILGNNASAITIDTPYTQNWERDEARDFCREYSIGHTVIRMEIPAEINDNPANRCYICKLALFRKLQTVADQHHAVLIEGTNFDDLDDYRPGLAALRELQIRSPLLEAEFTKDDVRQLSRHWGLPTSSKPAYACLLTRIPTDTTITTEALVMIEAAERALIKLGFPAVRVRHHDNLARIELPPEQIDRATREPTRSAIAAALKQAGYSFVTIDLSGYHMGSFNTNTPTHNGS
jgi:uncharacterized protein